MNGEQIIGTFYEKELQKINQKEFRMEKTIKRKGKKLYVKKFIGHKNLKTSIVRIQSISPLNSIDFCIEFIDFICLFSRDDFQKHDNIILSYFKNGLSQCKVE